MWTVSRKKKMKKIKGSGQDGEKKKIEGWQNMKWGREGQTEREQETDRRERRELVFT